MSAVPDDVAPRQRQRHTPAEVPEVIENAARILACLHAPDCGWDLVPAAEDFGNAKVLNDDGEPDTSPRELHGVLRICRRGTKVDPVTSGVDGVRGLRHYNRSRAAITLRSRRTELIAAALSFAKLAPVPEAWLLTYAGDLSRWPLVRAAACSLRPDRSWAAAVDDAGHRLVFARAVMSAEERALELGERKSDVLARRRDAETLLIRWLESASRVFLAAYIDSGTAIPARSTLLVRGNQSRLPTFTSPVAYSGQIFANSRATLASLATG